MRAIYRLNATELNEDFLETIKTTFEDQDIEIIVQDVEELETFSATNDSLVQAVINVEGDNNEIKVNLEDIHTED